VLEQMSKSKHRRPRISFVLFYKYFTLWLPPTVCTVAKNIFRGVNLGKICINLAKYID